jgi:hypothetical protein
MAVQFNITVAGTTASVAVITTIRRPSFVTAYWHPWPLLAAGDACIDQKTSCAW